MTLLPDPQTCFGEASGPDDRTAWRTYQQVQWWLLLQAAQAEWYHQQRQGLEEACS